MTTKMIHVTDQGTREEDLEAFLAQGRAKDCTCGLIQCMCSTIRKHKKDCAFNLALSSPVGIACDHGYDICSVCDPCTCAKS